VKLIIGKLAKPEALANTLFSAMLRNLDVMLRRAAANSCLVQIEKWRA